MARKLAQSTIDRYRSRLEAERDRLSELIEEARQGLEEARQTESSGERSPDPGNAEAGSMKFEYEKELSMQQNAVDLLHKVERALIRIDKLVSGASYYAIAYPVPGLCNPYYDPFRELYDYSCYGQPSEVVSFKAP